MKVRLRISETDYKALQEHLFPGDGCEAVAIALCGRRRSAHDHVLTVQQIVPIPYDECKVRTPDRVTWSTARLIPLLKRAAAKDLAIVKIHCHPTGHGWFSEIDDMSESDIFNSVSSWTDSPFPHASVVLLPDGGMFGRAILATGEMQELASILVPGDDIQVWTPAHTSKIPEHFRRHAQLFGAGTTEKLRELSIGVVGCSGTGSPLIEQLARLGAGRLVLLDPDVVELKNLNRIYNSSMEDAYLSRPKVEVMARAIARMGFGANVEVFAGNLISRAGIERVASCDIVFGCTDSVEARHILNRLCAHYLIPYFDLGVKLNADGKGSIDEVCGAIHYLKPEGSSLLDRRVFNMEQVRSEGLKRTDPVAYERELKAGYVHGAREDRPAVISVNTQIASMAVNEFLARLHPFRLDGNEESAVVRISFMQGAIYREPEEQGSGMFRRSIGRADVEPPLSLPDLGNIEK
jgi:hypothetical protein